MSQYFQAGELVLWNPSTAVAQVFARSAESLAHLVGVPSGLGPMREDECEIDVPVFARLIDALIAEYAGSTHLILRSMMEATIATGIVLVRRGGGELPVLQSDGHNPDFVALGELSHRHSQAMPR